MPQPSSTTRIKEIPPRRMMTSIFRAPASMLFSTSSFTTEAGRSTTSPAATWLARISGKSRMRLISFSILDFGFWIAKEIANLRMDMLLHVRLFVKSPTDAQKHVPPRFDLTQPRDNFERLMITVTDNAVRQLRVLLEAQAPSERKGL